MSTSVKPVFELPGKMEVIMHALSDYYVQKGNKKLQGFIVNARYYLLEGWDYATYGEGSWGHELHFVVPMQVYLQFVDELRSLLSELLRDVNKFVPALANEHISGVVIEMEEEQQQPDWREKSGVLLKAGASSFIPAREAPAFWERGFFHLFLSHKSEYKVETASLKESLRTYGITAFVAHEDIEPTKEWLHEIEKALNTMDALTALLTERFAESSWTDQEVGFAVGRHIPIIPIRLGKDPYGFMGKIQAIAGIGKTAKALAQDIFETLFNYSLTRERAIQGLVTAFEQAERYPHASMLFGYLCQLDRVMPNIVERLERAWETNPCLQKAYKVKAGMPDLLRRLRSAGAA